MHWLRSWQGRVRKGCLEFYILESSILKCFNKSFPCDCICPVTASVVSLVPLAYGGDAPRHSPLCWARSARLAWRFCVKYRPSSPSPADCDSVGLKLGLDAPGRWAPWFLGPSEEECHHAALSGFRTPQTRIRSLGSLGGLSCSQCCLGKKSRVLSVSSVSTPAPLSFDLSCLTRTRLGLCGIKEPVSTCSHTRPPQLWSRGQSPRYPHSQTRGSYLPPVLSLVHTHGPSRDSRRSDPWEKLRVEGLALKGTGR